MGWKLEKTKTTKFYQIIPTNSKIDTVYKKFWNNIHCLRNIYVINFFYFPLLSLMDNDYGLFYVIFVDVLKANSTLNKKVQWYPFFVYEI